MISLAVIEYQHEWELQQKKTDDLEVTKTDTNNWANTVQDLVLHLKLMKGVKVVLLAHVVRQHIKVAHILP